MIAVHRRFSIIALVALIGGITSSSNAQEKIVLRFADPLPANHVMSELVAKPWMEEVKKRTNGRVEFQYFPAEQLGKGKDMLSLVQAGVADIANVIPGYMSEKLPLSGVAELAGIYKTACEGVRGLWATAKDGVIARRELKPQGVHLLFLTVHGPYSIFTADKPLNSIADFKGLKLRVLGGPMDLMARKLNATPIRMSTAETHESLSRGTLDGVVLAVMSLQAYDLGPLVKNAIVNVGFGGAGNLYAISDRAWNRLPPDVQQVMEDAGREITFKGCEAYDRMGTQEREKLQRTGLKLFPPSDADHKFLSDTFAAVADDWSNDLERRGKPAKQALKEFREGTSRDPSANH